MRAPERIPPLLAHRQLGWEEALLVYADESEDHFHQAHLKGAISLSQLMARRARLLPDQNIIFYCDGPDDALAESRAAEFRKRGFENAMVLEGGTQAWIDMGYDIVTPAQAGWSQDQ